MGTAHTPEQDTLASVIAEALATGHIITACVGRHHLTGTLRRSHVDPERVYVVEVGNGWASPSFYPEAIDGLVWE